MRLVLPLALGLLLMIAPGALALSTPLGDCDPNSACYCVSGEFLDKPQNLGFLDLRVFQCSTVSCLSNPGALLVCWF